jgi:hypothetical protein
MSRCEQVWQVINAEKLQCRSQSALTHSLWQVSFLSDSGKRKQAFYKAEHQEGGRKRAGNYPAGMAGIIKKLTLIGGAENLPKTLALKSLFLRNAADINEAKQAYENDREVKLCAPQLLRALGQNACVIKRQSGSQTKYAMVTDYLGDGKNLKQLLLTDKDKVASIESEKLLEMLARLLAEIRFVQKKTGRVLLDIKLENIMPQFHRRVLTGFTLIDLDSCTGTDIVCTPALFNAADNHFINRKIEQIQNHRAKKSELLESFGLDAHLCAKVFESIRTACPNHADALQPLATALAKQKRKGDVNYCRALQKAYPRKADLRKTYRSHTKRCQVRYEKQVATHTFNQVIESLYQKVTDYIQSREKKPAYHRYDIFHCGYHRQQKVAAARWLLRTISQRPDRSSGAEVAQYKKILSTGDLAHCLTGVIEKLEQRKLENLPKALTTAKQPGQQMQAILDCLHSRREFSTEHVSPTMHL